MNQETFQLYRKYDIAWDKKTVPLRETFQLQPSKPFRFQWLNEID